MRVLEAGGTVEQHKAAVAAATAMKFDGAYAQHFGNVLRINSLTAKQITNPLHTNLIFYCYIFFESSTQICYTTH